MKKQIDLFLNNLSGSPKTTLAYQNALAQFRKVIGDNAELTVEAYNKFLNAIKDKSPSTQRVYTTAVRKYYKFCKSRNLAEIQEATYLHGVKSTKSAQKFNLEAVKKVIDYCDSLQGREIDPENVKLEALRDRAFVLTLIDTGLRISEACALKRSDIAWNEHYGMIGKGDKQELVRFSNRSVQALQEYINAMLHLERYSRIPPANYPLFARHDIRASKRVRPITPGGMWKAIKERIIEAGLDRSAVRINDFRHYFITTTYLAFRDLKISQELARHASISMTNRYIRLDKEIDAAYKDIFDNK